MSDDPEMQHRVEFLAPALLRWHTQAGRRDLPWQQDRSAYRVWVSEIMLQQTQVSTVIPYFERFMARFPDVRSLADAPIDTVLHLWTGLGYYARARNLHRAAGIIRDRWTADFPRDFESVASLPGVGRSTAGAILALSFGVRHEILDGNVKRVLARVFAIDGSPALRVTETLLWDLARACTPQAEIGTYTQAIMDLGATLCTRRRPACGMCPLSEVCLALRGGRQHELPTPKKRLDASARARRRKRVWMLLSLDRRGRVFLERRPDRGIWGGLWSLPEFTTQTAARSFARNHFRGARVQPLREAHGLAPIQHSFTHFDLEIRPVLAECDGEMHPGVMEAGQTVWYNPTHPNEGAGVPIGLPAPVKAMLQTLAKGIR